jgi:putative transposase
LGINRSSLYYEPVEMDKETLTLMNLIDEQYTRTPFYGSRRITEYLRRRDYQINRKRVQGLMQRMGLEAVFPGPNTSRRAQEHRIYPYLLKGLEITRPNQVWSTDITYIRLWRGFLYLVAVMDWYSRYVLAWRLSNSLDSVFCVEALEASFQYGSPDIFNSDQGGQFTSQEFTGRLLDRRIAISMDSRGRALDNVFIERLWRSVKYEEVYLNDYQSPRDARGGIGRYFDFYNGERPHQGLGNRTPQEVYFDGRN